MELKKFLDDCKRKCQKRLDEIGKEMDEIAKKNDKSEDEAELKALGDELAELEAEKAELEAELKEVDAQIEALDKPAAGEGENGKPERKKFLTFEERGGNKKMNVEERNKFAEEFRKNNEAKITLGAEKNEIRAVTIASGQIAIPTEVHGIENPAEVPYSTILDFVRVEDMTGAGYNKVALLKDWSEANATAEGGTISEDNPDFATVTIQPETGFKVLSSVSNEVLKTSPLNYYGKVEESAMVALRKKIASTIVTKAIGAEDDDGNAINASYTLSALDENTLRNIAFQFGGDEGIYGSATLVLNKKDLIALGDLVSDVTLQNVYEIEPNAANPNIGVLRKGGLSVRYILTNAITAFEDASATDTCMLYGDMKSIEVDLFGAYDIKVSEDALFAKDLLAIRGTAQVGVGVTRLHGLIEVKKGA
jgi:HK97 family phage major capsid protein